MKVGDKVYWRTNKDIIYTIKNILGDGIEIYTNSKDKILGVWPMKNFKVIKKYSTKLGKVIYND